MCLGKLVGGYVRNMKSIVIPIFWLSLVLMTWKASAQSYIYDQINHARVLHRQGELRKAALVLTRVIQEDRSEKAALLERGTIRYKLGEYLQAVEDFSSYLLLEKQSTDGYYKRGLAFLLQQNNKKALDDFSKAIELNSRYSRAYMRRGFLHNLNGHHQSALEDLDKYLSLEKNSFEGHLYRGVAYYFLGQPGNAIADYNRALRIVPKNALIYNNRGLAQKSAGQHGQADKDFKRARTLEGYPVAREAVLNKAEYYFKDQDIARELGMNHQPRADSIRPKLRLLDATVDLEQGHVTIALQKMERLLKTSNDPNLRLARAITYMRIPDYPRAENDLLVVLRQQPDTPEVHRMLGDVYYNTGRLSKAVKQYGAYFKHGGSDSAVRLRRAQASYISDNFIQAVDDYTELLKNVRGKHAWTYYRARGNVYLAAKEPEKAISDYQIVLQTRSRDKLVLLRLSEAYYLQGQHDKSLRWLNRGIKIYPENRAFYLLRAKVWREKGKFKTAVADLEKAVDISPDAELYYRLGKLYAEIGGHKRAIRWLNKSIQLNKKQAAAYTQRGILYRKEKKLSQAKGDWELGCQLGDKLACQFLQKL